MHYSLKIFKKNICKNNIKLRQAMLILNDLHYKCLILVDKSKKMIGLITEGDLMRTLVLGANFNDKISKYINKNPFYLYKKNLNKKSKLNISEISNKISLIPILSDKKKLLEIKKNPNFLKKKSNQSSSNAQVVIMAGGLGTRLKPFSTIIPKPLIPYKGKAIIEHIMDKFIKEDFKNFLISKNTNQEIIKAFFKTNKKKYNANYINEKKALGTAGSLGLIKNITKNFFVINCDSIINCNYKSILNYHKSNRNDLTVVVAKKKVEIPYGIFEFSKKKKLEIKEKPSYEIVINTGMYVFSKMILKFIKKNHRIDMNNFIEKIIDKNCKVGLFPIENKEWLDFGKLSSFFTEKKID